MLTGREAITSQASTMLAEIRRARTAMQGVERTDPTLFQRIWALFEADLRSQEEILRQLKSAVNNTDPTDAQWTELQTSRSTLRPYFREILAFVQGTQARAAGIDRGLCRIADALLDGLVARRDGLKWDGMTVIADREYFHESAKIIRLRFPDLNMWALPAAAHEFAHFLVGAVTHSADGQRARNQPLYLYLTTFKDLTEQYRREELFADIFATYSLGPSYALMCVLQRFDPHDPPPAPTYPASYVRVQAILETLSWMAKQDPDGSPFTGLVEILRGAWNQRAGGDDGAAAIREGTDAELSKIHGLLEAHVPLMRYATFGQAMTLRRYFIEGVDGADAPAGTSLQDVVNGAWMARHGVAETKSDVIGGLETKALEMANSMIDPSARPLVAAR